MASYDISASVVRDMPPHARITSCLDVALGVVELREYNIPRAQHYQLIEADNVVEMLLSDQPMSCSARFPELAAMRARPLGPIFFIPASHPVDVELPVGRQLVIRCAFRRRDQDAPRSWTNEELIAGFDVRSSAVRTAMLRLAEEMSSPGTFSPLLADGLTALLAIELRQYFRLQTERPAPGRLSVSHLRRIDERIEREGVLPSAAELAADCGLSKRHFSRLFRQSTGTSFADYAASRRMEQAKALLREDGLAIKQIAHRCGFKTPAAFSYAFHRDAGLTPLAYRSTAPRAR